MKAWLQHNYLQAIILCIFAGFALAPLYRHIYLFLGIFGLFLVVKKFSSVANDKLIRRFIILFLCLWLPMALSLIDTQYFDRSFSTTLRFLAYPLAAVAIFLLAKKQQKLNSVLFGCFAIMLFLSLDGIVQWLTGTNIAGYPLYGGVRIVGMFYPEPALSLFLAVFSPLFFEAVRKLHTQYKIAWLSIIPLITVIILGASRSAWMLFALSTMIYGLYFLRIQTNIHWKMIVAGGTVTVLVSAAVISQSEPIQQRLDEASGLFSGDYELANIATSKRLPLWQTAIEMTKHHWLNGVGPRAYTLSYDQHSDESNIWHNINTGQPHLYLLEFSSETGSIGLVGYLLFLALLLRMLWRLTSHGPHPAVPWGICAFVAIFPLNSTVPFFGYFGAQMLWFPLTLFLLLAHQTSTNDHNK